ncbi:MAG: DUF4392 domain-containing protein [Anaerovibrio sp.]|uniref:DUF4392 domain-containing protein n=1 Tax=Anaerovibrio sp. TaxID=1872532 RepID=UPI0025F082B9|nr:DUF4392 domain-containing protein [Anaerovibrio sp.]MCR5175485.1 DUF4392 domain-containing protein [Anaerovibrio sp.]
MSFFAELDNIMREDPGNRGLIPSLPANPVDKLDAALNGVSRVVLLTGFPVKLEEGAFIGETDGPIGTANIAASFERLGIDVLPLTDEEGLKPFAAALRAIGCKSEPICVPAKDTEAFIRRTLDDFAPTHLITLERPGKARDGHYHNMGGAVIDDMLADTTCIIDEARKRGVVTISVGDGGNEIGMGSLRKTIEAKVPHGVEICASECAEISVVSGVSNWWGWGISALLSLKHGIDLMTDESMEMKVIKAVVKAGSVDGCTKANDITVDNLSMKVHMDILNKVRHILRREMVN